MTTALKLNVTARTETGKALEALRQNDLIPAVLYGHDVEPVTLSVNYLDFSRALKTAGESTLIELSLEGKKPVNVLIQDVATHPLSGRFLHVDFYQVNMKEEIETDVPLEFVGESAAVKALSGVLIRSLEEVKIKCLPSDLPHALQVDLSKLATFDDAIKVGDIVLPQGVELLDDAETIVATVAAPHTEAEMEALNEKVEMDVTKVEGVVKETPAAEGEKKEEKK
jgi:large subunit ribosomal protein L25